MSPENLENLEKDIAKNTVAFTILMDKIKEGDKFVEDIERAELSRRTLKELNRRGYTTVVIYSDLCTDETKRVIRENACGYVERGRGMGPLFLQGLEEVRKIGFPYAFWLEVEKEGVVPHISKIIAPLYKGEAQYVVPARLESFDCPPLGSYPRFQAYEEMCGNDYFNTLVHRRKLDITNESDRKSYFDVWFGPDGFNVKEVSEFFFEYGRTDFPNKPNQWDIHILPIMAMIRKGKIIVSVPVDYRHPKIQADAEETMGKYEFWCGKRITQLTQITSAISEYNKCLG